MTNKNADDSDFENIQEAEIADKMMIFEKNRADTFYSDPISVNRTGALRIKGLGLKK